MKKLTIAFVFLFMTSPSLVLARTYTAVVCPWPCVEPYIIASKKGFFKKEGLDVEIKKFTQMPDWFKAISSGRFDFNIVYLTTGMQLHLDYLPYVFLGASTHDEGISAIVTKKNIKGREIKGKRIGVGADILGYRYYVFKYLESVGLTFSDVKLVFLSEENLLKNFIQGRLQAIMTYGGFTQEAVEKGNGRISISSRDYIESSLTGMGVPANRFKTIPKEDLKRYWNALFLAVEWMYDPKNENELMEIMVEWFKENPMMSNNYKISNNLKEYRKIMMFHKKEDMQYANTKLINTAMRNIEIIRKQLGKPHNMEGAVDITALKEVLLEKGVWK